MPEPRESLVGREVRSGSGTLTGVVRKDNEFPWISVEWSDGTTTKSDARLFPELVGSARMTTAPDPESVHGILRGYRTVEEDAARTEAEGERYIQGIYRAALEQARHCAACPGGLSPDEMRREIVSIVNAVIGPPDGDSRELGVRELALSHDRLLACVQDFIRTSDDPGVEALGAAYEAERITRRITEADGA